MSNNVSTPFDGAAVYWCREGVIDYKGNPMFVSNFCKKFNIQDGKCRIRNVSPNITLVFGLKAAFNSSSVASGETKVAVIPILAMVTEIKLKVPP